MALGRLPPAHLAACGCTQINLIWIGSAAPVPKQDRRHNGGSASVLTDVPVTQRDAHRHATVALTCGGAGHAARSTFFASRGLQHPVPVQRLPGHHDVRHLTTKSNRPCDGHDEPARSEAPAES